MVMVNWLALIICFAVIASGFIVCVIFTDSHDKDIRKLKKELKQLREDHDRETKNLWARIYNIEKEE